MTSTKNSADLLRGTWVIDPSHSVFEFSAKHAMVATVRGRFNEVSGSVTLDPDDPGRSSARIEIQADSVDTRDIKRDGHLKSPDFLDVERFPTITFTSTRGAAGDSSDQFRLWGDLTVRGVTREVELDVTFNGSATDPFGNQRVGFDVEGTLNRKDWGLVWNVALEAGGVLVSDRVHLHLGIGAIKQQD